MADHPGANLAIERMLRQHAAKLEKSLESDLIAYVGEILHGVDDFFRDAIEAISTPKSKLTVILTCPPKVGPAEMRGKV
jgi:hypothetical protein